MRLSFPWELQAPIFTNDFLLENVCRQECICSEFEGGLSDFPISQGSSINNFNRPFDLIWGEAEDASSGVGDTSLPDLDSSELLSSLDTLSTLQRGHRSTKYPYRRRCSIRASCNSHQQCGSLCSCQALQSIDPVMANPRSFSSRCVSSASMMQNLQKNGLAGRSLDVEKHLGKPTSGILACPCNRTYVSEACCANVEGLVWEPLSLKLGELRI